jgi:hypothetical protein
MTVIDLSGPTATVTAGLAPVGTVTVTGIPGPQGPPGPPGGPTVIAVPFTDPWPPANPQPNILYLRLAA